MQHVLTDRALETSPMAKVNGALTLKIQEFYDQIVGIYGCTRNFSDMRDDDLACGENRWPG